ncbi:probable membrane-associated kinase regulator 4, partial [Phalaenopsis equestris]|uniref:probable membrane-associated kinase regulator 4 n=1 Tax=Phalaenopsis equestris TaxID=78828 RepID=UPI0009E395EB
KDSFTSPADDLFHNGKLLPLQLTHIQYPQNPSTISNSNFDDSFHLISTTSTPFESCNISPSTSCCVSQELNLEHGFFHQSQTSHSWSKKLKLISQSLLGLKLRRSKAYLKSLFTKPTCSDDSCAVIKANDCSIAHKKLTRKAPFGHFPSRANRAMRIFDAEKMKGEGGCGHKRSFSHAVTEQKLQNTSSSTSSSSSSSSSSFSSFKSNSLSISIVNSEVEKSIHGAIAYCKKSQQNGCGRKNVGDVDFWLYSASEIAEECEKQESPEIG